MPRYYNRTRGPLPLSLPSGPTVVASKSYIDIDRTDEGCSAVAKYVQKGFLIPPKRSPVPTPPPAPAPVEAAAPVSVSETTSSEEEESSKSSSKKSRKKRTRGK